MDIAHLKFYINPLKRFHSQGYKVLLEFALGITLASFQIDKPAPQLSTRVSKEAKASLLDFELVKSPQKIST